jgi:hypothetical protein
VQGHTFADQRMKRLIELRWFHGVSSIGLKFMGMNFWSIKIAGRDLAVFSIGHPPGTRDLKSKWAG